MAGPGYLTECWCGDVHVGEPEGTTSVPGTNGQRGEGQWALGYREPLNKNEEVKRNDDGLNVRQRIVDIYSKYGFDSIDPADLRGRFRWYGLYTQRRPGSTVARPRCWSRRNLTTGTSCCGSGSTAASCPVPSCR